MRGWTRRWNGLAGSVSKRPGSTGQKSGVDWHAPAERAFLVGLDFQRRDPIWTPAQSLEELEFLALAPGNAGIVIERFAAISDGARAQATIAFAADIVVQ